MQNFIQPNPEGTVLFYKQRIGWFWSESFLITVCLFQKQREETEDAILVLFFLYSGSFAAVCRISGWICGNKWQCQKLTLVIWSSSRLPRIALPVTFNPLLCSFLLLQPWLYVQALPLILCLQMQKHLLLQSCEALSAPRSVITGNSSVFNNFWEQMKMLFLLSCFFTGVSSFWVLRSLTRSLSTVNS